MCVCVFVCVCVWVGGWVGGCVHCSRCALNLLTLCGGGGGADVCVRLCVEVCLHQLLSAAADPVTVLRFGLSVAWLHHRMSCRSLREAEKKSWRLRVPIMSLWALWVTSRHATSVWQGTWFSVGIGPASKATQ